MTRVAILGNQDLYNGLLTDQHGTVLPSTRTYDKPIDLVPAMTAGTVDIILICGTRVSAEALQTRRLFPEAGIVVLLSGSDASKRVKCLEHGADACLTAPASLDELMAIINSLCRRLAITVSQPGSTWKLLDARRQLMAPDGRSVALTVSELIVMRQLAKAFPSVVSRRQIVESMGQDYLTFDERRIEAMISRLRHKLPHYGDTVSPLRHARGQGYFFSDPIEMVSAT